MTKDEGSDFSYVVLAMTIGASIGILLGEFL